MTDALKEKIIIRFIKNYKNRTCWSDDYVRNNYADVIEYMTEKFDSIFNYNSSSDGSSSSSNSNSSLPTKNIKRITQGARTHEYYQDGSTSTSSGTENIINSDPILLSLLGQRFINTF